MNAKYFPFTLALLLVSSGISWAEEPEDPTINVVAESVSVEPDVEVVESAALGAPEAVIAAEPSLVEPEAAVAETVAVVDDPQVTAVEAEAVVVQEEVAVIAVDSAGTDVPTVEVDTPSSVEPVVTIESPVHNEPVAAGTSDDVVDAAREALTQTQADVTEETNLEEVFEAAERNYSLLKKESISMSFGFGYSYYRDDRIDIGLASDGRISRFLIVNDAQHSFSNSLGINYGIRDNVTLNTSIPLIIKYDTEKDTSGVYLGDISFGARWQPFPVKPGTPNTTLFTSISTATGKSPYKINTQTDVSSGKGYYSWSFGVSSSKVIDPVVLFASTGYTVNFDVTGIDQNRGTGILEEVRTGDSVSFSMGLAYSLSYEISLSASYSQGYSFDTKFLFEDGTVGASEDSTSSSVGTAISIRTSKDKIVSISFGFGLTEDSPDVSLGFSLPIEISGWKES